jgi:hypothetical protein
MSALLGVLLAATAVRDGADVAALERLWSGVRDSSEQLVMSADPQDDLWPQVSERRVRTIVGAVEVPWLGSHVLYLEEFLEDDPEHPRRQLLLQLEPAGAGHAVHVHLFTFAHPRQWMHLNYRPKLAAQLVWRDVVSSAGCDFTLSRDGERQFRGGTSGDQCLDDSSGTPRYLDYQLVIGEELYWYRRRAYRESDGQLQQEVIGFDRFEPNEARLYACRVAWSASGSPRELKPLEGPSLVLYEAGGRGRFVTPDGRAFQLTLHGRDWPFAVDRDALLLLLQEEGREAPLASAWAQMNTQQIDLRLGWLEVRCGSIAPDSDELAQ